MGTLPIESKLLTLKNRFETSQNVVLVAPPGSGKTTRVPLALLDAPWLDGKRILMLEPRRLAARAAAKYMASQLGEQVGETVGYRVRLDTRVGQKTRVEVITEGVLTRLLQADPALEGVGLVIFDEFHERSLQADVGLALSLQSQDLLREDLRLLVMSATLDAEAVAQLMGDAPIVKSDGSHFPVETRFLPRRTEERIESVVARTVAEALESTEGDILVFLPGVGEIRRVEARIAEMKWGRDVRVAPLYGNLSQEEQDLAIAPSQPGVRKIVLSTSIAETSLTVEGVKVVIDSGLMRVPRFSPRTGMTRLETVAVTRSSADQRRGRAGRLGPGVCYRLWTEFEDGRLAAHGKPEILETDLAPLALELAAWGVSDPEELAWLDPPPVAAYQQARDLLHQLGAIGEKGAITPHGRQMAELGMHPRLAHMILKAMPLGYGSVACELAALLNERDIFQGEHVGPNSDLRVRMEALHRVRDAKGSGAAIDFGTNVNVNLVACRRVLTEASHWKRTLGIQCGNAEEVEACGLLLAFAYPDRIAQRRADGRYLLRNGRGAAFLKKEALANEPYLVAAEVDDQGTESRIFLAVAVALRDLEQHVGDQIVEETQVVWEHALQAVRARKRKRLGALILKDAPLADPNAEETVRALCRGIQEEGMGILPWKKAARQLQHRLHFMHAFSGDEAWPDVSDEALIATLEDWLAPHLYGMKCRADLQSLNMVGILEAMLTWDQRRELDEHAPTHIVVPSGSRIPVDYSDPAAPVLAVRLQEMFGLQETPRIAKRRVPLTLHLLSPAQRPVQVTRDLANFWQNTYFEVRKDLRGRYPKHHWPDDPLEAMPTNRAKPRS
jgi:ATP-dependent helicase HrpB